MTSDRAQHAWRGWVLPATGLLLVLVGSILGLRSLSTSSLEAPPPRDCSLVPSRYLPGTFMGWNLARSSPDGGGEISARVRLDDGRDIVAYNATSATIARDMRVMVSEIVCIHRTVFLLTEFAAPEAGAR